MESDLFFPVTVPGLLPLWLGDKESVCTAGSIPGSGRAPGGGHGSPFQKFAWKIPWTEEPGGLQFHGVVEPDATEVAEHTHTVWCYPVRCPVWREAGRRWVEGRGGSGERASLGCPGLAALETSFLFPFLHWVSCVPLPGSCHGASSMPLALRSSPFRGRNAPGFVWPSEQPHWLPRALLPGVWIWELDQVF